MSSNTLMLKRANLPQFPDFTPLTADHQALIEKFVSLHEPYSDFNFISLWSWDDSGKTALAQLNGNLVIKMEDYLQPNNYIFSFLGEHQLAATTRQLLAQTERLALVPEVVATGLKKQFCIKEDRDNFDYIIATSNLTDLSSGRSAKKRWSFNQFTTNHGHNTTFKMLDINERKVTADILGSLKGWETQAQHKTTYNKAEFSAIKKLLLCGSLIDTKNLRTLAAYADGKIIAFSVSEVLVGNMAMGHFKKALRGYRGLGVTLDMFTAKMLADEGVKYINAEQDLGLDGLRKSKMSMRPDRFLKKYTIKSA